MWTLLNHYSFQVIIAHFIKTETRQLRKALLTLPELPSHDSEDQAVAFLHITKSYNIIGKISYICGNNYGLNNKIYHFISAGYQEKKLPY